MMDVSIFRLTPAYAFLIVMITSKLGCYLYDGPFWFNCQTYGADCLRTWHYNLLYYNNRHINKSKVSLSTYPCLQSYKLHDSVCFMIIKLTVFYPISLNELLMQSFLVTAVLIFYFTNNNLPFVCCLTDIRCSSV